jgi:hypothetical protein
MRAESIPWLALLALGAAHGINPAMGWLFAVGRALQERDRRALWRALGPLALGHALAIAVAITLAMSMGQLLPLRWMRWLVAASLLAVGVDGLLHHRHVRLAGMRVNSRQLATWSFLMASAHGAGLMVLPFILGSVTPTAGGMHDHHAMMSMQVDAAAAAGVGGLDTTAIIAPLVHTLGYLAMTVVIAFVVYEKLGLRVLRRAWINVNAIWSAALIAAAIAAIV